MRKSLMLALVPTVGLAVGSLVSRPVQAHPHIWIDVVASFVFDQGKVSALRFQWTFDEFFSAGVIGEFDKNADKKFDDAEIEAVRTGAFEGVKEVGYFTDILVEGTKVPIDETTAFTAAIAKGAAVYHFTVPLKQALDPTKAALAVSVYDKSYFVDIAFQGKDGVAVIGDGGAACSVTVSDDRNNALFGGIVFPKMARLQCGPKP